MTMPTHPRREEAIELVRSGRTRAEVAMLIGVSQPAVTRWCQQEGIEPVYGTGGLQDSVGEFYMSWLRTTNDPYIRRTWCDTLRQRAGLPPAARRDDEDPSPLSSCLAFDALPIAHPDPVGDTICLKCGRRTARTDPPCETRDPQGRLLRVTTTATCLRRQCGKTVPIAIVSAEQLDLPEEDTMPLRRPLPPIAELIETIYDDTDQGLPLVDRRTFLAPPKQTEEEEQPVIGYTTPQDKKDELFRRVRQGEHPADVGRNLGINEATAAELVRKAGISYAHKDPIASMRETQAAKAAPEPLAPDDKKPRAFLDAEAVTEGIRLCLEEGKSVMEAADQIGVNYHSLKNHVTKARRARDLQEPPGPKPMSGVRMADIAPEQPPLAVRLLTSPDVREYLAQPPGVQEAIVLLIALEPRTPR